MPSLCDKRQYFKAITNSNHYDGSGYYAGYKMCWQPIPGKSLQSDSHHYAYKKMFPFVGRYLNHVVNIWRKINQDKESKEKNQTVNISPTTAQSLRIKKWKIRRRLVI